MKIFLGIIVRQHHIDQKQMGLPKEQCAEWKRWRLRCDCSRVWVTNGGRILWNATCYLRISRIFYLMGNHHMKSCSEFHLKDQSFHLVQWSNITLFLVRTWQLHQSSKKVLPGMLLGYAWHAGGIWNGDISVADIEELEKMEACAIHATRLRAKEVLTPRNGENCSILDRRWNSQTLRRRSGSENIHLNLGSPRPRRRTRKSSRRIRRVFFNPQFKTHRCMMVK